MNLETETVIWATHVKLFLCSLRISEITQGTKVILFFLPKFISSGIRYKINPGQSIVVYSV